MDEQEKIIKLLKEKGISNYKIAKATGISEAAIGNYLSGKSKPNKIYTKCLKYYFESIDINNEKNIEVKESNIEYNKPCSHCIEKEKIINTLEKTIHALEKTIYADEEIISFQKETIISLKKKSKEEPDAHSANAG